MKDRDAAVAQMPKAFRLEVNLAPGSLASLKLQRRAFHPGHRKSHPELLLDPVVNLGRLEAASHGINLGMELHGHRRTGIRIARGRAQVQ